jgi:hypothetical protein
MYGSLIRRAVLLVPALAVAVCARDARVPRFDEKGRDRDELEALNARARIAAESREKERLERRREYTLAIRLDEPEEECLARLARTRACILTVRDFNNAASRWFPPADSLSAIPGPAEADSLRKNLLYTLLEDPYLDARISMSESKDSLQAVLAEAEAERIRNLRQNPGDSALRSLYRKRPMKSWGPAIPLIWTPYGGPSPLRLPLPPARSLRPGASFPSGPYPPKRAPRSLCESPGRRLRLGKPRTASS